MPNYGYHLARAQGRLVQSIYSALLPLLLRNRIQCRRNVPFDVFSYSSRHRLSEQVASIRSFLKHSGRPNRFVVISDGTHSANDVELLRRVDDCVCVEELPRPAIDAPASMASFLQNHPTGKQLAVFLSLPRERPALYVDSDVLFFDAAAGLPELIANASVPAYYLPDCGFSGDERLLHDAGEKADPVNAGMLIMLRPLDWSVGINRFLELEGEPNFFTNQTMTHLVMHANGAKPLDPAKYVLQLDDQFIYADRYAGAGLVLRHYVDPVRHKFWAGLVRPRR